jgi:hypothetical protein
VLSAEGQRELVEANRQLSELASGFLGDNAVLWQQVAELAARGAKRDAGFAKLQADLAVLQRLVFGRSSEKNRPEPPPAVPGTSPLAAAAGRRRTSGAAPGPFRAAGLLAPAAVRGALGLPRRRVLLPRMRGAVRAAGGTTGPGSSWTGRSSCGWWRTAGDGTSGRATAGSRPR